MKARAAGLPGRYERRLRRKDGGAVWTAVSATPELGPQGEFLGSFGMFTDVTEMRAAEEALRAEEGNLAAIFEASPVAMLVFDERANVVRANPAAMRLARGTCGSLLEHSPESCLQCGGALRCVNHEEDQRGCGFSPECPLCRLRNALERTIAGGASLRGVELALELDGDGAPRTVWLRMGVEPVAIGGARHVIAALDDITERKQAADALRGSETHFRAFFEQASVGMTTTSPEKGWLEVNDALRDMLGYSREELERSTWAELTYADDRAADVAQFERLVSGEIDHYALDKRFVHRSGRLVYTHLAVRGVGRDDGRFDSIAAVLEDITERKQAEEALRESEERFEEFAGRFPGSLYMHDEQRRYVYMNRRDEKDGSVLRAQWLGKTPSQVRLVEEQDFQFTP